MELLIKLSAAILLSVIMLLVLEKQDKAIAVVLSIAACCMILLAAAQIIEPIIDFIDYLQNVSNLDYNLVGILFKASVCAFICEITALVCTDVGYGSLAKVLQMVGTGMIIYLAIPLFHSLLDIISQLLGGL